MKSLEIDDFGFDIDVYYNIDEDDDITLHQVLIKNDKSEIDVIDYISDESYERIMQVIVEMEASE